MWGSDDYMFTTVIDFKVANQLLEIKGISYINTILAFLEDIVF